MSVRLKAISGPSAGSVKYDVLTMISLVGLQGSATLQASMMRLMAIITARYNWRSDELSLGQRDMARLWSVTERTAKREVKRLLDTNILVTKRAGVRGRVASYRLNQMELADRSASEWPSVGPDFAYRMQERYRRTEMNVVPLKPRPAPPVQVGGQWGEVLRSLAQSQPDLYSAWFADLAYVSHSSDTLSLHAPNRFKMQYIEAQLLDALMPAVSEQFGLVRRLVFSCD